MEDDEETPSYSQVRAYISVPLNHPTRYYNGDQVSGLVVIHSKSVLTTRSVCVVLVGTELSEHDQVTSKRDFYTQRVTLLGEDWPNRDNGTVLQLPPGKHTLPFSLQLNAPEDEFQLQVLPPSGGAMKWYNRLHNNRSVVAVTYTVRSFIDLNDCPSLRFLRTIEPFFLKPDAITTPMWPLPIMGHTKPYDFIKNGLRTGVSLQKSNVSLSCNVLLDRTVTFTYDDVDYGVPSDLQDQVIIGEPFCRPLKASLTVTNTSSIPVEALSVSLVQEVAMYINGYECWENEVWSYPKVNISAAATSEHQLLLRIPDGLTPHLETQYSKLMWFFRFEVHVGSSLEPNLVFKVPIHIISLGPERLLREILSEGCIEPMESQWSHSTVLVATRKVGDVNAEELAAFGVLPKHDRICTCCIAPALNSSSASDNNPNPMVVSPSKPEKHAPTPDLEVLNPIHTKALKWMPDEEVEACLNCTVSFGVFTRRHHCRLCGKVFCDNCAPITEIPAIFGETPQRACVICHVMQSPAASQSSPVGDYNLKNIPTI